MNVESRTQKRVKQSESLHPASSRKREVRILPTRSNS